MTMNREQQIAREILARHAHPTAGALMPEQSLGDIGIDSLKFIVLVLEIEQGLEKKIFDVDNVARLRTVGDVLRLATSSSSAQAV
jgi:acyl carrier protein